MIRIGIVGSRKRTSDRDFQILHKHLRRHYTQGDIQLVSGGCPSGADYFAEYLAYLYKIPIMIHYPDLVGASTLPYKELCERYYARNKRIAEGCDVLIALPAPDRRGGTESTIRHAQSIGRAITFL
jgi:hypothetical protein